MDSSPSNFILQNLPKLDYGSNQDFIENLFIRSLIESYNRIDKNVGIENEIRDRFRNDLYFHPDSKLKKWLQLQIVFLDWENWHFGADQSLGRTDFAFKLSGLKFIVECKRLKKPHNEYITEGLERFISLKYAKEDEFGAMAGFIIAGDQFNIASKLRTKISRLPHTNGLTEISSVPSFESSYSRNNNISIDIYHLFFDFSIS